MDQQLSLLSEIHDMKESWKIKVRVIRLWKQPVYLKPQETASIEIVLMDQEGVKIQATVKKILLSKFANILEEGDSYIISNFSVVENNSKYRLLPHRYKLNFYRTTRVTPCNFNVNASPFDFVNFEEIISDTFESRLPFDVIGDVVSCGQIEVSHKDGKQNKRLTLELEDLQGVKVSATIWDSFAQQFADYIADPDRKGCIIVIIQFAQLKQFQGKRFVSNSLYGSQLYINSEIAEINLFKSRLIQRMGEDSSNFRVTQISTKSATSVYEDFVGNTQHRKIDEIRDIDSPSLCIIVATIRFIQTETPWYYLACKKCNRKVKVEYTVDDAPDGSGGVTETQKYNCRKCGDVNDVVPRFKLQIKVSDSSGSLSVVLFDREAYKLINKSAYELCERMHEVGDMDILPDELNIVVDKKLAFKLDISKYNIDNQYYVYTVTKISEDEEIIRVIDTMLQSDQVTLSESDTHIGMQTPCQEKISLKDSVSCTGDTDVPSSVDQNSATSPAMKSDLVGVIPIDPVLARSKTSPACIDGEFSNIKKKLALEQKVEVSPVSHDNLADIDGHDAYIHGSEPVGENRKEFTMDDLSAVTTRVSKYGKRKADNDTQHVYSTNKKMALSSKEKGSANKKDRLLVPKKEKP